jgi:hypothetical protein
MRTPKQIAAQRRNWKIYQLYALAVKVNLLLPVHRPPFLVMIDCALADLGAETHTTRKTRLLLEGLK